MFTVTKWSSLQGRVSNFTSKRGIMLSVVVLSVAFSYCYAECRGAVFGTGH